MFDEHDTHRRKSSLVPSDDRHRQQTSCFVHQLLDEQRKPRQLASSLSIRNQKLDKGTIDDGDETHSRLLTKGQLLDMASGVRDLSKSLRNIRLKLRVKAVFVLVKAHDETLLGFSRELVDWLLSKERDTPYLVYVWLLSGRSKVNTFLAMWKILWKTTLYSMPKASCLTSHHVKVASNIGQTNFVQSIRKRLILQ